MAKNNLEAYYSEIGEHFKTSKDYEEVLAKIDVTYKNWLAGNFETLEKEDQNQLPLQENVTNEY